MSQPRERSGWFALALLCSASTAWGQPLIVDVVTDALDPNDRGDASPAIAVDPTNPLHVAVVSMNDTGSAGSAAPIFQSTDGGRTWARFPQIAFAGAAPGQLGSSGPGAQRIAFDGEGRLVVLASDFAGTNFIFRQGGAATGALTPGKGFAGDQPQLAIQSAEGRSHSSCAGAVYAAFNDLSQPKWQAKVATDSAKPPAKPGAAVTAVPAGDNATFSNRSARIATSPDGRVYLLYKTEEGQSGAPVNFEFARFRLVRSDDCGATFAGLGATGGTLVSGPDAVPAPYTIRFGNAQKGKVTRARASDAAIAVDPGNGDVYAAFVKRDASGFAQIYVARSIDGGAHFTSARATDGKHHAAFPALAVTDSGIVGLLYLDYDDSGAATVFRHRFARSSDGGTRWNDGLLQSTAMPRSDTTLGAADGYLFGDEQGLTASGNTFYGVFTGSGTGRARPQLDPIFFREGAATASTDFYVRHYTDSPTSGDDGRMPSAHSDFYDDPDFWSRRGDDPGTSDATTDRPAHQAPRTGEGVGGDNFFFARLRRPASGPAATVTARFSYAEFGAGTNFVPAGDPAGTPIAFSPGETLKIVAARQGHPWHLGATSSHHFNLGMELETADDPMLLPGLAGRAPSAGEVEVAGDNNKALRNTNIYEVGESQGGGAWAIVHNPALTTRAMRLRVSVDAAALKRLVGARVEIPGDKPRPLKAGDTIAFDKMRPGENRFLSLAWTKLLAGEEPVAVRFEETQGSRVSSGFTFIIQPSPEDEVERAMVALLRQVAARLPGVVSAARRGDAKVPSAALSSLREAEKKVGAAAQALERKKEIAAEEILGLSQAGADAIREGLVAVAADGDPLALRAALATVDAALATKQPSSVTAAMRAFLERLDENLTLLQKDKGDPADILQMVRWQAALLPRIPAIAKSLDATRLAGASRKLAASWEARKATVEDYGKLVESTLPEWRAIAKALPQAKLDETLLAMEQNLTSPTALQHLHRALLLALEPLAKD